MDVSFQLLLYILKVIYQEDQQFCILNVCDVMWKQAIYLPFVSVVLIAELLIWA